MTRLRLASSCDERTQVLHVVLKFDGLEVPRALVAAPVVDHRVEAFEASRDAGEGPASIEGTVHADDARPRILDAASSDGESGDRRVLDEVQSRGSSKAGRTRAEPTGGERTNSSIAGSGP